MKDWVQSRFYSGERIRRYILRLKRDRTKGEGLALTSGGLPNKPCFHLAIYATKSVLSVESSTFSRTFDSFVRHLLMISVQGINSTIAFGLFVKLICIAPPPPPTPFPFVFGCVNLTQFKMVSMRSEKPICSPPRLRSFPNVAFETVPMFV